MDPLIWFTTHLRSACLSGSVRKCATSSLICCVRNLSEIVLRRMVSGFKMLRRMLPENAVICACWVGVGNVSCAFFIPQPQFGNIIIGCGVTRISSFTSASRQYFRSLYFSRASLYLTASLASSVAVAFSVLVLNASSVRRSASCSSALVLSTRVFSSAAVSRSPTSRRTRCCSIARFRRLKSPGGSS